MTFESGRFVLYERNFETNESEYITSWDIWEQCESAFPIEGNTVLLDQETGRVWYKGYKYEWEAAST